MSSIWGKHLRLSIFGESHGEAIGAVLDGLPAGLRIDEAEIALDMARRAPHAVAGSTARRETDTPHILSGVLNGITTGAPLCAVIQNADMHSKDYAALANKPRPAHADYTAMVKYRGFADLRGGGHFSGRLTAPLVFAGAVARALLRRQGVTVGAHLLRVGSAADDAFDSLRIDAMTLERLRHNSFPVCSAAAEVHMKEEIAHARADGDSVGGVVECAAVGLPAGLGEPMFEGVEQCVAALLFSVPGVKGVEFGAGFALAGMRGSEANDGMCMRDDAPAFLSNHAGGVLGGITSGAPLIVRAAFKPTPSIARAQCTVDLREKADAEIAIRGRHDACIAVRGVAAVEAAVLLALADLLLTGSASEEA